MQPVEVKHLRRRDVDLVKKLVYVRRSKNETSHRVIPLNASALEAIARMLERADLLGYIEPDHFLWPACQWGRYDPAQPMLKWDTAWRALRDAAGLPRFRFHDLRHTVITELAELGVADHVLDDGGEAPNNSAEIPLLVALAEGLTSQSRHSLRLAGSPPSAKLLIPLARRDVRVLEGARLESDLGDAYRVIPKRLFAQSIQRLPAT